MQNGYFQKTFDTLEDLLWFLSRQQTSGWWGGYRPGLEKEFGYSNHYLDNVNMTFNDTKFISWDISVKSKYSLREFVFLDPDNRIFDPRAYIEDIIEYTKIPYKSKWHHWKWHSEKSLPEFRNGPVPSTGRNHYHRGSIYRHPKIMNEKRQAANVEYKDFIKPSRRVLNLPDVYDDNCRHIEKSWKSQSKKRKQWMK